MPPLPRVYSTPAIVLRQRQLGDADKILTLYSANLGKIDVVAKGVRKSRSRLAGHVEPMTQATFLLAKGKSLDIVTQAETIEAFAPLRDDLDRLSRGLYVCELLDRFTEQRAENFELYRLLLDTLRRVSGQSAFDTPVRFFEMALLDTLGYRPELDECVGCRERLRPVMNIWSAALGGVVCTNCAPRDETVRPLTPNGLKLLRLLLHSGFSDVARVVIDSELADELERCLREYLHWVLERNVRSADFIDTLRRPRQARPRATTKADAL